MTNNVAVERQWQPINTAPAATRSRPVDLWMTVYPSPRSFGIGDALRVTDCWRDEHGKWVHEYRGDVAELYQDYITHWAPLLEPPE